LIKSQNAAAIIWVDQTGSTNADLCRMAAEGAPDGQWLIARTQSEGKGRLGRAWHSPAGNFYGSYLLRLQPGDPPPALLAMVTAIALHDMIQPLLPAGQNAQIKWPNDVLLNGAKMSGILLERVQDRVHGDAVVIGIGVNLAHAPDVPGRATASLKSVGAELTVEEFIALFAPILTQWIGIWRRDAGQSALLT
jgi:BirA family transcriptional regulator, biotin operon repressor / biotin---[acetyl-CoA-carboxylase] ligase